jgi:hypothetical protein
MAAAVIDGVLRSLNILRNSEGTNDMFRFNGIGTTIYGKREVNPEDGSYVVTKWFAILSFL